ncbi:MAG: hypothetical protein JWL97_3941 [Gemmatimonadales bacterium]|jgi:hypothetical protein|nr:hypothetical protein [Gemmatimonadales bacterium]
MWSDSLAVSGDLVRGEGLAADAEATATLFQLLSQFLDQREKPDGLAKIFRDHQSWLNAQTWYHFETPAPDHIT